MLREQAKLFKRIAIFLDAILVFLSMWCAYHFRMQWGGLRHFHYYLWILVIVVPVWYFLLTHFQLYASIRRRSYFEILTSLANVHLFGGAVVAGAIYLVDPKGFSRGFFLGFLVISFLFLSVGKILLRLGLGQIRRRGFNTRHLLIVGARDKARKFSQLVSQHEDWGLKVVGFVQINPDRLLSDFEGYKVLGRVEDLVQICKSQTIDEVVFCPPNDFVVDAEAYLKDLEEMGISVRMVLDFFDSSNTRRELTLFHNQLPILTFHSKEFNAGQLFLKRLLDVVGALVGLVITACLFPFIAFAIKRNSPGPLFFGQERVGHGGRIFKCWKFRSMYIDAEERKAELMAHNEMDGAMFKMKDDPRVTRVGRFLRKTSLDEFPQFWNVLIGEMSLVGTRPPTPAEVKDYENWHRRRISIKPGITGNWQVSGRSEIKDFDTIVRLDLAYIDSWSLWLDLKILLQTLRVIFLREGSC
jgi:exopolysaccharide biosynthesis polyprenyl glycosylphosphotransferase